MTDLQLDSPLLNSHSFSNVTIAIAYATISLTILAYFKYFPHKTRPLILLSAAFILSCGTGHLLSALNQTAILPYWHWLTAVISWMSVVAFAVVLPRELRRNAILGTIIENIPVGLGLLKEVEDNSGQRRLRWQLVSNRAIVDLGQDLNGMWFDESRLGQSSLSIDVFLDVLDTSIPILRRELEMQHPFSGQLETYLLSCVNLPGRYLWVLWQDVTDRKIAYTSLTAATQQLEWQATHDYLTQAGNLVLFDRLQIQEADRFTGLLSINLDRFKTVNETLGHSIGDVLLQQIVERFQELLGEGDVLVRTGADAFLILLEQPTELSALEAMAQKFYGELRRPFICLDREIKIEASVGLADCSSGNLALMRIAGDIAMQVAKRNPLGKRIIVSNLALMDQVRDRQEIGLDLERALQCVDDEFELYYQPIVPLDNPTRCYEVEALIRWTSPNLGVVSPGLFIPIAEQTGAIAQLSDWVIERSIIQVSRWANRLRIAVNVSPWDLERDGFVDRIISLCQQHQVQPSRIALEITERAVTDQLERFSDTLQQLSESGIRLKIDDFGTGDSGLGRILAGRWSEIKIDRSLLPENANDFGRIAICRAIANLCHDLNIRSLAEGVETEEQRLLLSTLSIEDAQGFLFARPMTEQHLEAAKWVSLAKTAESAEAAEAAEAAESAESSAVADVKADTTRFTRNSRT